MRRSARVNDHPPRKAETTLGVVGLVLLVLAASSGCQKAADQARQTLDHASQAAHQAADQASQTPDQARQTAGPANQGTDQKGRTPDAKTGVPRLVDLGAGKCIPCKKMAPILDELRQQYAGVMEVEFIDVWENPGAGDKYGIRMIPTQIFYDASGKELFRHEGFFAKEDILAKWRELGVELRNEASEASPQTSQ